MREARILAVALEGLENILKAGQEHYTQVSKLKLNSLDGIRE